MDKRRIVLLGVLGFLGVCLVSGLIFWIFQNRMRAHLLDEKPLVLIHAPTNRESFRQGEIIHVHATAHEQGGIEAMQLWLDGELISEEITAEGDFSTMVFHDAWIADLPGEHIMIVTAASSGSVQGQASLRYQVVAQEIGSIDLASEAQESSSSTGEDRPSAALSDLGATDAGPAEYASPPGSFDDFTEHLGFSSGMRRLGDTDESFILRFEVLSIQTDRAYAGLHCYLGAGRTPPQWYPDEDGDQTTNESFPSLGGGAWDVAATLSGEAAPSFSWDPEQPIELDVTCVGLAEGGRDAVEIGRVLESVVPEAWDGIAREAGSDDIEGHFSLLYRVTVVSGSPPGYRIDLDPSMTPPTNLRLGAWTFEWRYEPRPDEEEIDGFRVYANDTLQWMEPADARRTGMPYEWLHPPCGTRYWFYVDAFRVDDESGELVWSPPSNTFTIEGDEPGGDECGRRIRVSFDELITFRFGGDADHDHDDGIGPVYGSFYAGDQFLRFHGRTVADSLYPDRTYSIRNILSDWGDGGRYVTVDVPEGESLQVGFDIKDRDLDLFNNDDQLCEGSYRITEREIDEPHDAEMTGSSLPNGCRVTFSWAPAFGSVVASGHLGVEDEQMPPVPMLVVSDLSVDEERGQLEIHVRNDGRATWPGRELDVLLFWPSEIPIGAYTIPAFVLRPGDTTVLTHPDMRPSPPLGACVLLDPGDEVYQEDDFYYWSDRGPFCRDLPDLVITEVDLDEDENRLWVYVKNIGFGTLEDRSFEIEVRLDDTTSLWRSWSHINLGYNDTQIVSFDGLDERIYALMQDGYQLIVDPSNAIAEEDGLNNFLDVPVRTRLRVSWSQVWFWDGDYDPGWNMDYDEEFIFGSLVEARNRSTIRPVANWQVSYSTTGQFGYQWPMKVVEFDIAGDEAVAIYMWSEVRLGPACVGECRFNIKSEWMVVYPQQWVDAPTCDDSPGAGYERMSLESGYPDRFVFGVCRLE